MSVFQPAYVIQRTGQDVTVTATVTGDVSAFALKATFRDQLGSAGTVWATKTTGAGIVATYSAPSTSIVITLDDTDTDGLTPGPYVWRLERTDAGAEYDLIDWSTVLLTPDAESEAPQLVNLSQVIAGSNGVLTETPTDTEVKYRLQLIAAAEATFRRLTGRNISFGSYTEYLDAPVRGNLWVRETPIQSITSIAFDGTGGYGQLAGTFGAATLLDSTTDYYFRKDRPDGLGHSGEIFTPRREGWGYWAGWVRGSYVPGQLSTRPIPIPGAWRVIYRAGYKLVPGDIIQALTALVAQMAQRTPRGTPLQSEAGFNYSYSLASAQEEVMRLDSVQNVIAAYRRGNMLVG